MTHNGSACTVDIQCMPLAMMHNYTCMDHAPPSQEAPCNSPWKSFCLVSLPIMSHRLNKRELRSPGVCLSRNLCSLVLYGSFVLLRVEEKNNPFIFSALLFGFYSNCYCDRGCEEEEYQCQRGGKHTAAPMQRPGQMTAKEENGGAV